MAKRYGEKQKLLYILKILTERTDAEHCISVPRLIEVLNEYGIEAERKSVYRDLEELEEFGYDIIHGRGGCCFASRDFELAELKLLADAVQASPIITEKKTKELIGKLSSLASCYDAQKLRRSLPSEKRTTTENESVYYNVDAIYRAVLDNRKIAFYYFDWTPEKEQRLRHGGAEYKVSPWGLWWDDEKYYLIAFDDREKILKNYRVDKMKSVRVGKEKCEGEEAFAGRSASLDTAAYSKKMFGMYGGEECTVTLECDNSLAGVIIDRFGADVSIFPGKSDRFTAYVPVMVSNNFFSWVFQFGKRMKITAPADVCEQMSKLLRDTAEEYEK